jgi:hypothetical protein
MNRTTLIVAEMRAGELLATLISALSGAPHWRLRAAVLVGEIEGHKLPELSIDALREADARKRAAEMILEDACNGGSCVF